MYRVSCARASVCWCRECDGFNLLTTRENTDRMSCRAIMWHRGEASISDVCIDNVVSTLRDNLTFILSLGDFVNSNFSWKTKHILRQIKCSRHMSAFSAYHSGSWLCSSMINVPVPWSKLRLIKATLVCICLMDWDSKLGFTIFGEKGLLSAFSPNKVHYTKCLSSFKWMNLSISIIVSFSFYGTPFTGRRAHRHIHII